MEQRGEQQFQLLGAIQLGPFAESLELSTDHSRMRPNVALGMIGGALRAIPHALDPAIRLIEAVPIQLPVGRLGCELEEVVWAHLAYCRSVPAILVVSPLLPHVPTS